MDKSVKKNEPKITTKANWLRNGLYASAILAVLIGLLAVASRV